MASKKELKRKLHARKTKHRLEMSDLHIELHNTSYNLGIAQTEARHLVEKLNRLSDAIVRAGLAYNGKDIISVEQSAPKTETTDVPAIPPNGWTPKNSLEN